VTLDVTEAVADATESDDNGADGPSDVITVLASARDIDVVNDISSNRSLSELEFDGLSSETVGDTDPDISSPSEPVA
jgi:hypothetical protein